MRPTSRRSRTEVGCRWSIALGVFTVLMTWRKGREIVTANRSRRGRARCSHFIDAARRARVPRSARPRYCRVPQRQPPHHAARAPRQRRAQPRPPQAGDHRHDRERAGPAHLERRSASSPDHLGNPGDGITGLTARFGFQDVLGHPGRAAPRCRAAPARRQDRPGRRSPTSSRRSRSSLATTRA